METRIAFSSHQEPLRNAPGKSPTPTWCTAKALCQRHANIAILSAICISLHAFWRGAWGLPLQDEWECPIPPKRVSHLAKKKKKKEKMAGQSEVMGQKRNLFGWFPKQYGGKFLGFHYCLMWNLKQSTSLYFFQEGRTIYMQLEISLRSISVLFLNTLKCSESFTVLIGN